jgi:hypothetical protein
MVAPTYLVATPTNFVIIEIDDKKDKIKILHGTWICSLKQI